MAVNDAPNEIQVYHELGSAPYYETGGLSHPDIGEVSHQGDLMGFDTQGRVVHATAAADGTGSNGDGGIAAGVSGPIAFRGVLFPERITDPDKNSVAQMLDTVHTRMVSNDTIAGDHRVMVMTHGFAVQNGTDTDWGFTPGEDVYLDVGGGLTQTKPATAGQIVQKVGFAWDPPREEVAPGESVWIQPGPVSTV